MDKKDKVSLDHIEGLTPVDLKLLAEFKQVMTDNVIPEIVDAVEMRRLAAAENRHKQLKC